MNKAYDKDFGALCAWLQKERLTMHTPLNGSPFFRKKPTKK